MSGIAKAKAPRKPAPRELAPATLSEADGVRYLHLGTPWVQGAMRIREPKVLELEYIRRMMVWMLMRPPAELTRGRAVQLGLGAAAITRYCHGVLKMKTTAVELNPTVIEACRLWFRLPKDSRNFEMIEGDAGLFVANADHAGMASVLCVDVYDHEAAAPVLDSQAFYRHCFRVLDDDGVMTVNLFGRDASFARSAGRIAAAFGASQVRMIQPTREGNTIVLAWKGADMPERDALAARAENIETRFGLAARKWLKMIRMLPAAQDSDSL